MLPSLGGEAGNGEQAPMDEDAELGVVVPGGQGAGVQGVEDRIGHAAACDDAAR